MLVLGAGGFAKEFIKILLLDQFEYNENNLFFFDDINYEKKKFFNRFIILNSIKQVSEIYQKVSPDFCVAVGMPKARYALCNKFESLGGKLKSVISPKAILGPFEIKIGDGSIIMHEVVISSTVKIGKCTLMNVNTMVGHDSVVGDFCDISPGVIITGHSKIGNYVQIGSGAIILPGVKIGDNSFISAGSVISQDIPENSKVVGTIPSRVIEKLPPFFE